MQINLSSIRESVTGGISYAATSAAKLGRNIVQLGTQACSKIGPTLQALVVKIKNIQPSTYVDAVKTFLKSSTGRAFAGVGIGIASFAASQKVENSFARVALLVVGVCSVAYSAICVFKPGFTVLGVRI